MQEFLAYAKSIGLHISESQKAHFQKYLEMLLEWNQKFNLTGITEPEDIWKKHFLDSLTVLEAIPTDARKIVDIGSGAGFPGLPLAIVRPDLDITLIEGTGKKVNFLLEVIRELGLKNVRAIHGRAEEGKKQYDVALARAVAMLPKLWQYAEPALKKGGILIAQKKSGGSAEIYRELVSKVIPINIPSLPERELVIIKKI